MACTLPTAPGRLPAHSRAGLGRGNQGLAPQPGSGEPVGMEVHRSCGLAALVALMGLHRAVQQSRRDRQALAAAQAPPAPAHPARQPSG